MTFQFDPHKAASNQRKHGVSFADAEGVFYDDFAIHKADGEIVHEERHIALGMNSFGQILVVIYTFSADEIRLISARRATKHEREQYESGI